MMCTYAWIKYFATVACYLAVVVYARRHKPSTTPTPLAPATPEPLSIPSCMDRILSGENNQTARFIVMMKKGHGRSFRRRHSDLHIQE